MIAKIRDVILTWFHDCWWDWQFSRRRSGTIIEQMAEEALAEYRQSEGETQ